MTSNRGRCVRVDIRLERCSRSRRRVTGVWMMYLLSLTWLQRLHKFAWRQSVQESSRKILRVPYPPHTAMTASALPAVRMTCILLEITCWSGSLLWRKLFIIHVKQFDDVAGIMHSRISRDCWQRSQVMRCQDQHHHAAPELRGSVGFLRS